MLAYILHLKIIYIYIHSFQFRKKFSFKYNEEEDEANSIELKLCFHSFIYTYFFLQTIELRNLFLSALIGPLF